MDCRVEPGNDEGRAILAFPLPPALSPTHDACPAVRGTSLPRESPVRLRTKIVPSETMMFDPPARWPLIAAQAGVLWLALALPATAQDASPADDRAAIEACLAKEADAPEHCIGAVYNTCTAEPSGSTTAGMGVCAQRETAVWQIMMDESLKQLLTGPLGTTQAEPFNRPPENRRDRPVPGADIINDMQQTWLVWRAKMCDTAAMQYEGGSLSRVIYGSCIYEETARHALWLKSLTDTP